MFMIARLLLWFWSKTEKLNAKYLLIIAICVVVFWDAILLTLDKLVAWVIAPLFVFIFERILDTLFFLLDTFLTLLPLAPDDPFNDLASISEKMGFLDRYIPVTEVTYLLAFVALGYSGLLIYKIFKLIRGGG